MGRHTRHRGSALGVSSPRAAVAAAALGLGALQFGGIAFAAPAAAPAPTAKAPTDQGGKGVGGTPCTDARIKACVDLSANRTWLLDGTGHVVHGPVRNAHGAEGRETPTGDFVVQWKNRHHRSTEFKGAEMPYAVFFDTHGRAFHAGDLRRESAGCVRLKEKDAKRFFEHLNPNDRVQIVQ